MSRRVQEINSGREQSGSVDKKQMKIQELEKKIRYLYSVIVVLAVMFCISTGIAIAKSSQMKVRNHQADEEVASSQSNGGDDLLATPEISSVKAVSNGIEISWKKVSGAEQYRIFRKNTVGNWDKIGNTAELSFVDENVMDGTTYTYTVRCLSGDGKSYTSSYDNQGKSLEYHLQLETPVISKLSSTQKGVKIQWNEVEGAALYRVFRKNSEGKWDKIGNTSKLSFVDENVEEGGTYTYTLRCVTEDGKTYTSQYVKEGKTITYSIK